MSRKHLAELTDGWTLWRSVVLRSAGFPAVDVLPLAGSDAAAAADLIDEAAVERAREAAIRACRDAPHDLPQSTRKALTKAIKRMLAGATPEPITEPVEACEKVAVVLQLESQLHQQREALAAILTTEGVRIGQVLRDLVRRPSFLEALLWQNRKALTTAMQPLLASQAGATDHDTRHLETFAANYVQRYALKNDTIGFFGPIAWAELVDSDIAARIQPSSRLLAERGTYFEFWAIAALAEVMARDRELRIHLPPRRIPAFRVEGTTVVIGPVQTIELPVAFARLLQAADGLRAARELAAEFVASGEAENADEVFDMLDELAQNKLILWRPEMPSAGAHPERALRAQLERVEPNEARTRALSLLQEFEDARTLVEQAAGDVEALRQALDHLDSTFERITGRESTRNAGRTYAARSIVYEDTRRDIDVEIGRGILDRLAPPLVLLFEGARWFTYQAALAHRTLFEAIHTRLREARGSARIDFLDFLDALLPELGDQFTASRTMKPVVDQLRAHWSELLAIRPDETSRVQRSAAQLHSSVLERFRASGPGWPSARYHSPDVMLAANGPEALARGEFFAVLGEIVVGDHTYSRPLFLKLHPNGDMWGRVRFTDLGRPIVAPVEAASHVLRSDHHPPVPEDIDIEVGDGLSWRPRGQVVAAGELVIEPANGRLIVRTRDGRRSFEMMECFDMYLQLTASSHYAVVPRGAHTPRVTIDDLVIARETWRFEPAQFDFCRLEPKQRFLGARRFARQQGLPRFVFAKIPEEPKPWFVDFASPLYIEILAKLCRKATTLTISEMLPAFDDCWLPDASGQRYTSELRMAALDPKPWS